MSRIDPQHTDSDETIENNMADTTLSEIVAEGQRSLVLFDAAGIKAVQALMTEKNGKP